jgi:hypothetical protein
VCVARAPPHFDTHTGFCLVQTNGGVKSRGVYRPGGVRVKDREVHGQDRVFETDTGHSQSRGPLAQAILHTNIK